VPLFAICRGLQEVKVARGGSLHQHVHEVEGRRDHRSPKSPDMDVNYAPAHDVDIAEGGLLQHLLGERRVNPASHELGAHHGRRCAVRGLPNVMKVRQFLLRVACVDRGRRLLKHPCGELIYARLVFSRRARLSRQILACFFLLICVDFAGSSCSIAG
jgi:hypothetical protein